MNQQVNYIVQGFLLGLLILITGVVVKKFYSIKPVETNTNIIIDYELPKKETASVGVSYQSKMLFMQKCASCHHPFKDGTGPALSGFEERGPWAERRNLYAWIKNPSAFMKINAYTKDLKKKYGSMMTAFPDITNEEIDKIAAYIEQAPEQNRIP